MGRGWLVIVVNYIILIVIGPRLPPTRVSGSVGSYYSLMFYGKSGFRYRIVENTAGYRRTGTRTDDSFLLH